MLPGADSLGSARYQRFETLAWRLFLAGLSAHFLLSAHALLRWGYPYEAPLLGPFPFKIHPGTYLMLGALCCALASRGHPLRAMLRVASREPLLAVHMSVMVTCLVWVLWRHGTSGAAFIVDTHWLPAIVAMTLLHFDDERRAFLLKVLVAFMAANALIALLEYASGSRLTPLFMQGQASGFAAEEHFRSSALLGHPLVNAKMTATFVAAALLLPIRGLWKWAHVLLLLLSLLAFGGRAALALAAIFYGSWGILNLLFMAVQGRFSYLQLTGGSVVATVVIAALAGVVVATGLGERIFAGMYMDNSASVRLRVWSAYEYLTAEQLWFGISAREIDLVALRLGLDPNYEAIENGWIYLSMQFGLVVFALWVLGFGCLVFWLLRTAPALACVGIVIYLLSASTSNSFASKTITQGLLVTYAMAAAAQVRLSRRASSDRAQALIAQRRRRVVPAAPLEADWSPLRPGSALLASRADRVQPLDLSAKSS